MPTRLRTTSLDWSLSCLLVCVFRLVLSAGASAVRWLVTLGSTLVSTNTSTGSRLTPLTASTARGWLCNIDWWIDTMTNFHAVSIYHRRAMVTLEGSSVLSQTSLLPQKTVAVWHRVKKKYYWAWWPYWLTFQLSPFITEHPWWHNTQPDSLTIQQSRVVTVSW